VPFTETDLDDLLRWLETRPALQQRLWRALLQRQTLDALREALATEPDLKEQLLRALLTEHFLDLPALVARLAEAQQASAAHQQETTKQLARLTARVDALATRVNDLAEAQLRTEQRLDQLTQRVDDLAARLEQLTARVDDLAARLEQLTQRVDDLTQRVEALAQAQLRTEQRLEQLIQRVDQQEQRVRQDFQHLKDRQVVEVLRERPGWFRPFLHNPLVLTPAEVDAWLLPLLETGQLSQTDYQELLRADLLVRGQRQGQDGYLVVEASWTIGPRDIQRARQRAALLHQRAGVPAWPVVAGYRRSEQAARLLAQNGVFHIPLGDEDEEPEVPSAEPSAS
jgi:predicted  nucleic acid-binding Zn-ribbon protein